MKTTFSDLSQCYSFALVTYIPDPLRSFLEALRRGLPGEEDPQAYITILPPRALRIPIENASLEAQRILSGFAPFSVRLAAVNVFEETNVLYLDLAGGNQKLHQLHTALNAGSLADDEGYEFLPHLTISGSIAADDLTRVRSAAERAWGERKMETEFEVNEVVALCQPLDGSWNDWSRVWTQKLGEASNSASVGT